MDYRVLPSLGKKFINNIIHTQIYNALTWLLRLLLSFLTGGMGIIYFNTIVEFMGQEVKISYLFILIYSIVIISYIELRNFHLNKKITEIDKHLHPERYHKVEKLPAETDLKPFDEMISNIATQTKLNEEEVLEEYKNSVSSKRYSKYHLYGIYHNERDLVSIFDCSDFEDIGSISKYLDVQENKLKYELRVKKFKHTAGPIRVEKHKPTVGEIRFVNDDEHYYRQLKIKIVDAQAFCDELSKQT